MSAVSSASAAAPPEGVPLHPKEECPHLGSNPPNQHYLVRSKVLYNVDLYLGESDLRAMNQVSRGFHQHYCLNYMRKNLVNLILLILKRGQVFNIKNLISVGKKANLLPIFKILSQINADYALQVARKIEWVKQTTLITIAETFIHQDPKIAKEIYREALRAGGVQSTLNQMYKHDLSSLIASDQAFARELAQLYDDMENGDTAFIDFFLFDSADPSTDWGAPIIRKPTTLKFSNRELIPKKIEDRIKQINQHSPIDAILFILRTNPEWKEEYRAIEATVKLIRPLREQINYLKESHPLLKAPVKQGSSRFSKLFAILAANTPDKEERALIFKCAIESESTPDRLHFKHDLISIACEKVRKVEEMDCSALFDEELQQAREKDLPFYKAQGIIVNLYNRVRATPQKLAANDQLVLSLIEESEKAEPLALYPSIGSIAIELAPFNLPLALALTEKIAKPYRTKTLMGSAIIETHPEQAQVLFSDALKEAEDPLFVIKHVLPHFPQLVFSFLPKLQAHKEFGEILFTAINEAPEAIWNDPKFDLPQLEIEIPEEAILMMSLKALQQGSEKDRERAKIRIKSLVKLPPQPAAAAAASSLS